MGDTDHRAMVTIGTLTIVMPAVATQIAMITQATTKVTLQATVTMATQAVTTAMVDVDQYTLLAKTKTKTVIMLMKTTRKISLMTLLK